MDDESSQRTSTRLRIQGGNVVIRCGPLSPVIGSLADLSEGGCQCVVLLGALESEVAEAWRPLFVKDQVLSLEINTPPYLQRFELQADVRHVQVGREGAVQFGLRFLDLRDDQKQALQQAIMTFAMKKVKGAFSGGEESKEKRVIGGSSSTRVIPPSSPKPAPAPEPDESLLETAAFPKSTSGKDAPETSESAEEDDNTYEAQLRNSLAQTAADKDSLKIQLGYQQINPQGGGSPASETGAPLHVPPPPPPSRPKPAVPPPPKPVSVRIKPPTFKLPPLPAARVQVSSPHRGLKLGELLIQMGKITEQQVEGALSRASASGERLGRFLLRKGLISPEDLCRALSMQSGLPQTVLSDIAIPRDLIDLFPYELMAKHLFVPFDDTKHLVCLAVANPLYPEVLEELEQICQRRVEVYLTDEDMLLKHLDDARPKDLSLSLKHQRYGIEYEIKYRFCNRLRRILDPRVYNGKTVDVSEGDLIVVGQAPAMSESEIIRQRGACLEITIDLSGAKAEILCGLAFIKINAANDLPWQFGLKVLEANDPGRQLLKEICSAAGKKYNFQF